MKFTDAVRSGAQKVEALFGGARRGVKSSFNLFQPPQILPFRGYGTRENLILMGRVVEKSAIADLEEDAGFWRNVRNSVRRLDSDEIPGAVLEASFRNETWDERCDHDGFFRIEMKPDGGVEPGWHDIKLDLVESIAGDDASATARVIVPSPDSELMVISDIDDTVIETGAMDTLHMIRTVLFKNARQRSPFPGVVGLYEALVRGNDEKGENPIFYLSRSGWPLYDLFDLVFETHDIPQGPLLLRDLRIIEKKSTELGTESHKSDYLRSLLEMYDFPAVLIGDSGQHDPEVYREIVDEYGDRIAAVYIRHVVGAARAREIEHMFRDHLDKLCLAPSTMEMARHARAAGLISDKQLESVQKRLMEDLKK